MTRWSRYESVVDQQIRMAQERGDFDDLPGKGKPLRGLDGPGDDLWWVREYVRREGLSTEALLPPSLQLRKEVERLPETVRSLPSESAVREIVADLNTRIASWMRTPSGPAVPLRPVVADEVVEQWRAGRPATTPARRQNPTPSPPAPAASGVRPGRWRRLVRRLSRSF
ncbi:MAG: DUF1992 domain-containing protein [Pseudonocardia sp.]|nr:DUF1992 domain-containing protein [Pseudonocardia sp.]